MSDSVWYFSYGNDAECDTCDTLGYGNHVINQQTNVRSKSQVNIDMEQIALNKRHNKYISDSEEKQRKNEEKRRKNELLKQRKFETKAEADKFVLSEYKRNPGQAFFIHCEDDETYSVKTAILLDSNGERIRHGDIIFLPDDTFFKIVMCSLCNNLDTIYFRGVPVENFEDMMPSCINKNNIYTGDVVEDNGKYIIKFKYFKKKKWDNIDRYFQLQNAIDYAIENDKVIEIDLANTSDVVKIAVIVLPTYAMLINLLVLKSCIFPIITTITVLIAILITLLYNHKKRIKQYKNKKQEIEELQNSSGIDYVKFIQLVKDTSLEDWSYNFYETIE